VTLFQVGVSLDLGEIALLILAVILSSFFASLILVLKKRKEIRRLLIRYIEIIVLISPATLLMLLGDDRIKQGLLYSTNNVQIFSLVIPMILFICGFAVLAVMVYEVLGLLKKDPEPARRRRRRRSTSRSDKARTSVGIGEENQ
jgi:hypothetical protein